TCTVDGSPATVTGSGPYSVAVAGEGSHPVSCSVDDNAGNSNGDSDTVKIDLHAPTSLATSPTYNNDGTIDVTYTASDTGGSGLTQVDLYVKTPGGPTYVLVLSDVVGLGSGIDHAFAYGVPMSGGDYVQGTYRFYTRATDVAGNVEAAPANPDATTTQTLQDSIAPAIDVSHTADGSNGWNISDPVTVTVTASDAGSGLAGAPSCTVDGSSATLTGSAGTWTPSVAGERSHPIGCSVDDSAGNTNSDSDTVTIDTVDPSISVSHSADGSNDWNITSPVTVDVTASDATSGLAAAPSCLDGATALVLTPGAPGTWTTAVASDGSHAISCSVDDSAGNANSDTDTVTIDTVEPTISVSHTTDRATSSHTTTPTPL